LVNSVNYEAPRYVMSSVIIIIIIISYHRFPFPWQFSSSTTFAPHHSGFKFQIVAVTFLIMCDVPSTAIF